MYLYEIGHSDWESHAQTTLQHEKLFTKEEFDDMVADVHVKAFYKYKEKVSNTSLKKYSYHYNFENFWEHVPKILIADYGFRPIEIVHRFYVNSMDSIAKNKLGRDKKEENLIRQKYQKSLK